MLFRSAIMLPATEMKIGLASSVMPVMPVLAGFFVITGIFSLLKSVHFFILNMLAFTILLLIVGVMGYDWYVMEIATLFLALGIFSGIVMSYSPNIITNLFLEGVKDIMSAALVVGLAGGIIIILTRGQIIDTLLFYASGAMDGLGKIGTVGTMYVIQTAINVFIPSEIGRAHV